MSCSPASPLQVQSRYEGIPRCVVQDACRTCPVCLMSVKQTNSAELKPILSSGFLTRAQIDLIDMRHKPDGDYNYIAHYMDHWSKYHVIWPLKRKTADEVANGLNERVFPYLGLPRIIHSDNGREFVNRVIREVVKDWGGEDVMFVNGRPRHSQSQGLVEQGNATIERHVANRRATLGLTDNYPWASWLPKIQYNMNTDVAGGTKKTPYEVVFGQPPRTTIFPDAKVTDGVINEEDLPFELNRDDTNGDNQTKNEVTEQIQEEIQPSETERRNEDTEQCNDHEVYAGELEQRNEYVRPSEGAEDEQLPPISKPTPKPRKRQLKFSKTTEPKGDTESPISSVEAKATTFTEPRSHPESPGTTVETQETTSPEPRGDTESPGISVEAPATNSTEARCDAESPGTAVEAQATTSPEPKDDTERPGTSVEATATNSTKPRDENAHGPSLILDPTSRHYNVRKEADANYRENAEKMKLKYSKRKRVIHEVFSEGDLVTVRVPKIDRSSTDPPRLVAKILHTKGKENISYKLKCKFGILEGWYRTGELMPYGEICSISFNTDQPITLREAAR